MRAENDNGANIVAQIADARQRHHHGVAGHGASVPHSSPPGSRDRGPAALGSAAGSACKTIHSFKALCVIGEDEVYNPKCDVLNETPIADFRTGRAWAGSAASFEMDLCDGLRLR